MEYRPWQSRFLQWLDTQPSGSVVNLCGGPWGKTFLSKMNQDPHVSYYHSVEQMPPPLQNGKKVVVISIEPLKDTSMTMYEIEATFANQYDAPF
jgi:hypothetical protein